MKTIFITERPTQIITALAICEQLNLKERIKVVVANQFHDAAQIVNNFSKTENNIVFQLASSYEEAIKIAAAELPAHLFIHWDVGFRNQTRLRHLKKKNIGGKISIFEEGVGTYRNDIYPYIKRKILKLLKFPVNVGGSKYVSDIYVYDKERYINNSYKTPRDIIQITHQLDNFIAKRENQFSYVFSGSDLLKSLQRKDEKICAIYLSNWNFKETDLKELMPDYSIKVLKLHPHCQIKIQRDDIIVSPNSLPAEFLIMAASKIFESVIVYHHGSSVTQYINNKNIKFVKINTKNH